MSKEDACMKFAQLLFSPTGGTQKVTAAITGAWEAEVETIDLTDPAISPYAFEAEALVLIAIPSYGGRVPSLAAERLERIQGGGASCVLVCVYGNRAYEDTLVEMQDCAESRGFQVIAAVAAIAEHSILHQYAAGRPDRQDAEELQRVSRAILEKHRQGKREMTAALPGNRPYKKAGGVGMVPKAGGGCTGCGLCAAKCPAQAISPDELRKADSAKCISCMRCVVRCPQGARKVNGALVSAAGLALKKACSVRKECELFL
jgi:NAD-dependent dihydropyrimidine dehydrogenase PreA subunit